MALAIPNLADVVSAASRGLGFAVLQLLITGGGAFGSLVVGIASDRLGSLLAGMYILVIPTVAGGLLSARARPEFGMQFVRRLSVFMAVMAAVVLGLSTQANAADPPKNVGWLYTLTNSGAVFFDADLAGSPSYEKITVCDNVADGRGIVGFIEGTDPNGDSPTDNVRYEFKDPSSDGNCRSWATNYFADGYRVFVQVCEYHGDRWEMCRTGRGVA